MEIISPNNNICLESRSKTVFWRKQHSDTGADISLRSITPHIVRSRLLLFGNVLVDQKRARAIHNIRSRCTIHRPAELDSKPSHCGSIHFGFCKALREQHEKLDVKSHVEKFENVSPCNSDKKRTQVCIPIITRLPSKEKLLSPTSPTSPVSPFTCREEVNQPFVIRELLQYLHTLVL